MIRCSTQLVCDPMDLTVHGIIQARILEWVAFPFSRDLPNPWIEPRSPALQADYLPAEPQGKPKNTRVGSLSLLPWIFPTQESNQGLLHCWWILYQLSYQGSPVTSEMQIKITLTNHLTPFRITTIKKNTVTNAGKAVERWKHMHTVGGNANQYSHYGKQYRYTSKNYKWNYHMIQNFHSQVKDMVYIYTVEYYSVIKRINLPFATTWMDLAGVMLMK